MVTLLPLEYPVQQVGFNNGNLNLNITCLQAYENELMEVLKANLLIPACNQIETNLRLHHHMIQV